MKTGYLNEKYSFNDPLLVAALDEFSLWSAPFGLKLLECVEMKHHMKVLDIGPGTGFPMLEIAQRLGVTSYVYGIDPWDTAMERINKKISFYGQANAHVQHAVAENIPFPDQFFDLIISNNGLNNVDDLDKSLSECHRVAKPGTQMVITMNLPDTFIEFYTVFRQTLTELKLEKRHSNIDHHIFLKRKPLNFLQDKLHEHGFRIEHEYLSSFTYKFSDGSALLNYSFFKICFLDGWKSCIDPSETQIVFEKLEANLNTYALQKKGIELTVPFVCFSAKK